jgi:hypothetical protein
VCAAKWLLKNEMAEQLPLPDFIDGCFIHAQSLGSDWDVEYIQGGL